jgi:hypothetical protein
MSPAPLSERLVLDPLLRGCMEPKERFDALVRCVEGRLVLFLPDDLLADVGDILSSGSIVAP